MVPEFDDSLNLTLSKHLRLEIFCLYVGISVSAYFGAIPLFQGHITMYRMKMSLQLFIECFVTLNKSETKVIPVSLLTVSSNAKKRCRTTVFINPGHSSF